MKTTLALLFALAQLAANAQFLINSPIVGGDLVQSGPGTSGLLFTTGTTPETFRSIGVYDADQTTPGLFNSHVVGLWDATTHALLASATVPAQGATAIGDFQWVNLAAPLVLAANHTYALGMSLLDNDFDFQRANVPTVTVAPGNTLGSPLLSSGSGFEFPDIVVPGAGLGFFGPNLGFAPVPELPSFSLIAACLLAGFAAIRRRLI